NSPMFSMDVSGLETLIVWQETNTLEARMLSGDTPPGWPVSIEASGAPVLVAGTQTIIVPQDTQSVVLQVNSGSVSTFPVPEWDFHAVAAVDPGAQLVVAAVRSDGRFAASVAGNVFDLQVGPGLLTPVIGEFSQGQLTLVAAAIDSVALITSQRVVFIDPLTHATISVSIPVPTLCYLSLAGFANLNRLEVVVADSVGGIHLLDRQ